MWLVLLLSPISYLLSELKVTPVANVSLLGGQYFLEGESDSFAGNTDIFFAPVINFSEKTALLPIYQGVYSGTKDVKELVGGGTLTREILDNLLTLKFIRKFSDTLKGKAKLGYKLEYLKETEDEKLGDGLFDYGRIIAGLEAEKMFNRTNVRIGYDFYMMNYPNYASLVTTYQTSIDTATYTEISQNAGEDVLDYSAHELFVETLYKFSETTLGKLSYNIALKNFTDQTIVEESGSFTSDKRNDLVHLLTLGISQKLRRVSVALYDTIQIYTSNQNSYDANRTQFNANYYNFVQNSISPALTFALGKSGTTKLNLWWEIVTRVYQDRPAQDESGNYQTAKITQTTNTTGVSLAIPVYKMLSLKTAASYRGSVSNNKYEANYRYNYNTSNYFVGINWEY
ncbi:MAG: hypothetical protein AB1349_01005 [Elusimicrobiota bacterium]